MPYLSLGHGPLARRLIAQALGDADRDEGGDGDQAAMEPKDRHIIDGWAGELGISGWYEWGELPS